MSKSSSSSSINSSSSSSSSSSRSSNTSKKSFTSGFKPQKAENKLQNSFDFNGNEKKEFSKEKTMIEEAYATKNVGMFGMSFLTYIGSKAKSIFSNEPPKKYPEFTTEDLTSNKIINRVSIVQCSANNPVEDRFNAVQLKNIDGYFVTVLDGHGGNQLADYANKRLHLYFDNRLKFLENSEFKFKQMIEDSFTYTFENIVSYLFY